MPLLVEMLGTDPEDIVPNPPFFYILKIDCANKKEFSDFGFFFRVSLKDACES